MCWPNNANDAAPGRYDNVRLVETFESWARHSPANHSPAVRQGAQEDDPRRATGSAAERVARATDAGLPAPPAPACQEAIPDPTDSRCSAYDRALADYLEDAREQPCPPRHLRAEDFSCGAPTFYAGRPALPDPTSRSLRFMTAYGVRAPGFA